MLCGVFSMLKIHIWFYVACHGFCCFFLVLLLFCSCLCGVGVSIHEWNEMLKEKNEIGECYCYSA